MAKRGRQIVREIALEGCTLSVAAQEFYRHNKVAELEEITQKAYMNYVEAFVKWCGENTYTDTIKIQTIERYFEYKQEQGVKQTTVVTTAKHLRRFINFCIDREYMYSMAIKIPKCKTIQKEPYTPEEMKLLLEKPKSNNFVEIRNWTMVNYFYATGQRLSSVLNIKVEHLDLKNHKVFLEHNKDGIEKWTPLSSGIVKILEEYIDVCKLQEQDYLFPEYEGKQLKNRSCQDSIAEYNKSRGVSKTSIHLFRHTFAKTYIMNGGSPAKLQQLLHHKTIDMTMKYVKLCCEDVGSDLDVFCPLDNFKRRNYTETKRRKLVS